MQTNILNDMKLNHFIENNLDIFLCKITYCCLLHLYIMPAHMEKINAKQKLTEL